MYVQVLVPGLKNCDISWDSSALVAACDAENSLNDIKFHAQLTNSLGMTQEQVSDIPNFRIISSFLDKMWHYVKFKKIITLVYNL